MRSLLLYICVCVWNILLIDESHVAMLGKNTLPQKKLVLWPYGYKQPTNPHSVVF